MKIKCIKTKLTKDELRALNMPLCLETEYGPSGFGLVQERAYNVMGVLTYKDSNNVEYLIDVGDRPFWFPYLLFEIQDHTLPPDWCIRIFDAKEESLIQILCGFYELCTEPNFFERLIEREGTAMLTYDRRLGVFMRISGMEGYSILDDFFRIFFDGNAENLEDQAIIAKYISKRDSQHLQNVIKKGKELCLSRDEYIWRQICNLTYKLWLQPEKHEWVKDTKTYQAWVGWALEELENQGKQQGKL